MLICNIVGARPNFVKMAPVIREMAARALPQVLVHTGQHYDVEMSVVFFEQLGLPQPDFHLGVGADGRLRQIARMMAGLDEVLEQCRPTLVIVAGDVNSTVAGALAAAAKNIPVAHVEAGLRSFDRTMPEEINRIVTDSVSEILFTTEESANRNLLREGKPPEAIHFVGNCMVDSLRRHLDCALARAAWRDFGLEPLGYAIVTLHRPSNVDEPARLARFLDAISEVARRIPVVFPVHPRTRERIESLGVRTNCGLRMCPPVPYLEFLGLLAKARLVLTDSGGIQEETTALGVPCLTLRTNTERPVTIEMGTNRLVGEDPGQLPRHVEAILAGDPPSAVQPPLWDGQASKRVVDVIEQWLAERVVTAGSQRASRGGQ